MIFADDIVKAAFDHAAQEQPRESCGLVIVRNGRQMYVPCKNVVEGTRHFAIDPEDYADAEDRGEVVGVVHSHVYIAPQPSQADLTGCEKSNLPWLIVNWPVGSHQVITPSAYTAPLIGREYMHGVLDCFALAHDYYLAEHGIEIGDVVRDGYWWKRNENILVENFERMGFYKVDLADVRVGDALIMQIDSEVPNHIGVYLGDGRFLHHAMERLSSRDVFGGYWLKHHVFTLRHKDMK